VSPEEGEVFRRDPPRSPRAELLVAALLLGAAAASAAFVVLLFATAHDTQLLGLSLGAAFACLSAALIVAAKLVLPHEHAIEDRPQLPHPGERPPITVPVTRRRLLLAAAGAAGTCLAAALVVPITALGPKVDDSSPWRRGRALVDEEGRPIMASDLAQGSFLTAFPEGADRHSLASPVVVVRDDPRRLDLPTGRRGWAPQGLLAYSKICTHAGCAVALYRKPTYQPTSAPPALACPCHYSVFATRSGGTVVAGPAGRPLPQLPLQIGPRGELRAAGPLSGSVGPAWWGAKR
jgi:ubiquinol-cytochrome c reductase iron-sulfur subunit